MGDKYIWEMNKDETLKFIEERKNSLYEYQESCFQEYLRK